MTNMQRRSPGTMKGGKKAAPASKKRYGLELYKRFKNPCTLFIGENTDESPQSQVLEPHNLKRIDVDKCAVVSSRATVQFRGCTYNPGKGRHTYIFRIKVNRTGMGNMFRKDHHAFEEELGMTPTSMTRLDKSYPRLLKNTWYGLRLKHVIHLESVVNFARSSEPGKGRGHFEVKISTQGGDMGEHAEGLTEIVRYVFWNVTKNIGHPMKNDM